MVSNIFYFHPYLWKIPILTNIFQRGWNHQPVIFLRSFLRSFPILCRESFSQPPKWVTSDSIRLLLFFQLSWAWFFGLLICKQQQQQQQILWNPLNNSVEWQFTTYQFDYKNCFSMFFLLRMARCRRFRPGRIQREATKASEGPVVGTQC